MEIWPSSGNRHGSTEERQKNIAPTLYKKAKRKNLSVRKALQDNPWISHITPLSTTQEIREYVMLWEAIGQTQLHEDREDNIRWWWTVDGEYTAKSAYGIQFQGSFSKLRILPIWKAKAEPKCKFFTWTLLYKKILTANNLIKRNWSNEPTCKACGIYPERQYIFVRIVFSQRKFGQF